MSRLALILAGLLWPVASSGDEVRVTIEDGAPSVIATLKVKPGMSRSGLVRFTVVANGTREGSDDPSYSEMQVSRGEFRYDVVNSRIRNCGVSGFTYKQSDPVVAYMWIDATCTWKLSSAQLVMSVSTSMKVASTHVYYQFVGTEEIRASREEWIRR